MPIRLIPVARNFSLIGLVLGTLAASAAELGPPPSDAQPQKAPRPNPVRFADGSAAISPDEGAAPSPPTANAGSGVPLVPVADPKYLGPAEIEVTSFHGITPGASSRDDVEKTWGKPRESRMVESHFIQLYSVDPFPRVEVSYTGENKVASLVIRFQGAFPAAQVAEQLELSKVPPVLVSNDLGEILGQSYPERGVLFSFEASAEPGKGLKKVTHIVLEPITAEPFVLRAESNIETRPEFSLHDADQAIKLQSGNARAHWLRSRAMTSLGQHDLAVSPAAEAARLDPHDARYQVTKAQALQQSGHIAEAAVEAEKAIAMSENRPHVKARAICLLGDLKGAGPHPDHKQALQLHMRALQAANALVADKHPAIRIAAKEVLLDAHLGALHDIAWGPWREKERSAQNWIAKAAEIAQDLVKNEDGSDEYRFRLSARALSADVGLQGKLDPEKWAKEAVRSGEVLISAAPEPGRKAELQWEVAMSLYDAMQVYQLRADQDGALHYGESAIRYLEKSGRHEKSPSAAYLMGRAYFRMGAVYANSRKDHHTAVGWYEKAVPLLGRTPPPEAQADLARLGDTFVSMGVSYWSEGDRKKAVALTQHGADLVEEAVRRGSHDRSVLAIPYANLAAMKREMGDTAAAGHLQELAERAKGSTIR